MTDCYEIEVKYAALQAQMKILVAGKVYLLTEFCEEAGGYVFVTEMWGKKPYSLSMTDIDDIIKARHAAQRASEA